MSNGKNYGIHIKTSYDGKGFEQTEKQAKDTEKKVSSSAVEMSKNYRAELESIRRASFVVFGAVSASLGLAVREATKFEYGIAKVSTLLPKGSAHLAAYSEELKKIATSGVSTSLDDLTEATYQALSASVDAGKAMSFVNTAAQAATAGFTDAATAVDALSTVLNSYKLSADEATRVSDILFAAQNRGKTTFGQMAHFLGYVVPVAASVGVKFEEIAGAIASLTKQGLLTRTSMTGLRAIMAAFVTQGDQATLSSRGLIGALNDLYVACDGDVKKIQEYLGGVEAITPALALMGKNAAGAAEDVAFMYEAGGTSAEAFSKMADTAQSKVNSMKGAIKVAADDIGKLFIPALISTVTVVGDVAKGLGEWAKQYPELTKAIVGTTLALTGFTILATTAALLLPKVAAGYGMTTAAIVALRVALVPATTAILAHTIGVQALATSYLSAAAATGLVLGMIGVTVVGIGAIALAVNSCKTGTEDWSDALKDATENVSQLADATGTLKKNVEALSPEIDAAIAELLKWRYGFVDLGGTYRELEKEYRDMMDELVKGGMSWEDARILVEQVKVQVEGFTKATEGATSAVRELDESMKKALATARLAAGPDAWKHFIFPTPAGERGAEEIPEGKPEADRRKRLLDLQLLMQQEHNAVVLEEEKKAAADRIGVFEEAERQRIESLVPYITAYQIGVDSIVDKEMTGKERREAMWNAFRLTAVRQIGMVVLAHVLGEKTKQSATIITGAVQVATVIKSAAIEIAHMAASIGKALMLAAAKIYAFFASLGPFGIPLAAATVVGIVAAVKAIKFQEGGLVPGFGFGDRVPAMLEPGEFVVRREVVQNNYTTLKAMNEGRAGGGDTFHVTVNAERSLSYGDMLNIRRMVEETLPSALERLTDSRSLRPGYAVG